MRLREQTLSEIDRRKETQPEIRSHGNTLEGNASKEE